MPISRDVLRRTSAQPTRIAITGPCGPLTFGDLSARARHQAALLPETRIVLDDTDPVALLVGLLAADLAGVPAVVVDRAWPPPVRDAAVAAADRALGVRGSSARLVIFSSGSTGDPKPVVRTTTSWTHSFPSLSAVTGVDADDTVLIPGAMSGSLFLFGAVHALTVGAAVHPLSRWSPGRAAEAARECTVVHLVPTMLAALSGRPPRDDRSTQSQSQSRRRLRLRLAVCAGSELPAAVEAAAGESGVEVVEYYGAAELSVVGYRGPAGRVPEEGPSRFRPFPGVEPAVERGVLKARSPYLALSADRDPRGYATAGDTGELHSDGTFSVHGRAEQAIQTGGSTISSEGVERFLRTLPSVADAAVVGLPHTDLGQVVAAVIEPAEGGAPGLPGLRSAAADALAPAARPRYWYTTERLPRTGSGKLARAQVRAGLTDGSFPVRPLT